MRTITLDALVDALADQEVQDHTATVEWWYHDGGTDGFNRLGITITHVLAGLDDAVEWPEAYIVEDVMNGDANPRAYATLDEAEDDAAERLVLWTIAYTCDYHANTPARTGCTAAAADVRPDALWLDHTAQLPEGWTRNSGGHLCPEHTTAVAQGKGLVGSLVWNTSTDSPGAT